MSAYDFSIGMNFEPQVNPQKLAEMLNIILRELKTKLGAMGDSIDFIDGDSMAKELDKVKNKYQEIANNTQKTGSETDKLVTSLKGATNQAGLLGKSFQFNQISQSISTITGALAPFINEFIEFDKQIKNIGTLGFENFEKFNASLSNLAAEIPGTAADMANATYQAISAGVQGSVEEVTNFVRVAAKAGVAGMSDTSTAVDGLTSVINAYGLKVSEVDNVASTFFAGIKLGKTSFNEMVGSIASFVPSASALGVGFDQATAAIARYTAMGTPTAQVGTQMNAVFTLLAKGTAPLNKALGVIGTDLDTLRNKLKLPVEDGGGLVNVMREIKLAAEASGVQLAALTGRVEAAKIIESLAGSQDKYNASLAVFNNVLTEIDNNAAEQAFQVAATSIAAQTDGILATVQGYFNAVFQEMGSGATTILATVTQLSPAITGIAGMTTLFGGMAKNVKDFAISMISRVAPSIITTSAASGAATISFGAMWTALTGPVGLAIAGIVAVSAAIYLLVDSLNESTQEKLDNAKADEEMIGKQQELVQAEQKTLESKQSLINQYDKLSSKTNLTAEEQSRLQDTITKLNQIYPGAISSTKSYEENLKSLGVASSDDTQRLSELRVEMVKLDEESKKATIKRVELETEVNAENLQENLLDEIDNFLGGNSKNQVDAVSSYVDSIKDAANPEEANRALLAFNTALWNNPMFKDIPPEARTAMATQAKGLVDTRTAELEEKSAQASDRINKALNDAFSSGATDFSQLTTDQKAQIEIDMKTSGKTKEDVKKMFDDIEKDARDLKLGEIISESTKVSGDLKGAQSLDSLVESFKSAESEIQRAAIGKLIGNIAPEAVSATGKIKDANGDLVTSYALLEDKVEESKNKQLDLNNAKLDGNQGKFIEAIDQEGEKIKENTASMDKLQEQISQKVRMGLDTSELESQYQKLKSENDSYTKDVVGIAAKWINSGLESEEMLKKVADSTGLSVDEAEKLVNNMKDAKDTIEDTEEAVKSLGDVFNEDLANAGDKFKSQLTELTALERERQRARESGDKETIKSTEKKYREQLKATKEANAELKILEKTKKSTEDLFKEKKVKGESEYQRANKTLKIEEKSIKNNLEQFKIEQELQIAQQGRKKTTEDDLILKQRQLQSLEEQKKSILEQYKITEGEDGEIKIGIKVKSDEQEDVNSKITEINNQLAKENIGIITLNSKLNIEEEEIQRKVTEQNRKNLEYQVEIGLRPRLELVNILENDLQKIEDELDSKSETIKVLQNVELTGTITEEQKIQLKKLKEEFINLENDKISIEKSRKTEYKTIYDEELNVLKTKHESELSEVENRLNKEAQLRDVILNTTTKVASIDISKDYDEQFKRLDDLKEAQLITEQTFNKRREELELEHSKKLQIIQETAIGSQLEAQRQADLQKMEMKRQQLVEEMAIEAEKAKISGDDKRLEELNQKIGEVEKQIADKSDIVKSLATDLQGNITEIFSSITGDEESMKEPWRKAFAVVAGAIKELASAAAVNMILGQLGITASTAGLAGLLVVPMIKGLVSAGINSIMNPILSSLLSFSTGGRVDEPTLAWVGDASNSRPGADTEWILRDDQLRYIIKDVIQQNYDKLVGLFDKQNVSEDNKEILNSLISAFERNNDIQERMIDKTSSYYDNIKPTNYEKYVETKVIYEKAKEIEFYNYVKEFATKHSDSKLFEHITQKQNELINNIDNSKYNSNVNSEYAQLIKTLKSEYIESESQQIYDYDKVERYVSEIHSQSISNEKDTMLEVIKNMINTEYNFVEMVKNVVESASINQDKLDSTQTNEVIKQFTNNNINQTIKETFVTQIKEVTHEIKELQHIFKEKSFTSENLTDFVKNFSNIKHHEKEYISNKISSTDYKEQIKQSVLNVNSYASGSPFLATPELAIIGDAGANNPEIVLNSPQLEEIMRRASGASIIAMNKKMNEVINAINNINLVIGEEDILDVLKRKQLNTRKKTRVM